MEKIGQVHIVDLPGGVRVGCVQKLVRYAAYLQEGETALLTLVSEKLAFSIASTVCSQGLNEKPRSHTLA